MEAEGIRAAMEAAVSHFAANPHVGLSPKRPATARIESGLLSIAQGPDGALLVSDMPRGIGGGASAPTPGWFLRAALANCNATVIAMRAAQTGITLKHLEVRVDSESDDRGLLGAAPDVSPGPQAMRVTVRIAADGVSTEQLHELVRWVEQHSPVNDALRRSVSVLTEVLA